MINLPHNARRFGLARDTGAGTDSSDEVQIIGGLAGAGTSLIVELNQPQDQRLPRSAVAAINIHVVPRLRSQRSK